MVNLIIWFKFTFLLDISEYLWTEMYVENKRSFMYLKDEYP